MGSWCCKRLESYGGRPYVLRDQMETRQTKTFFTENYSPLHFITQTPPRHPYGTSNSIGVTTLWDGPIPSNFGEPSVFNPLQLLVLLFSYWVQTSEVLQHFISHPGPQGDLREGNGCRKRVCATEMEANNDRRARRDGRWKGKESTSTRSVLPQLFSCNL